MKKLSLDAFKARMKKSDIQKTEKLIGGILGDCHCVYGDGKPCDEPYKPTQNDLTRAACKG